MLVQTNKNCYKVATKAEHPWMENEVAVFKRIGPFNWKEIDIQISSVEDAEQFIKYADMLGDL